MSVERTIGQYFEYLNAERWSELAGLFEADATYRTPGARPRSGVDDVIAQYRTLFRNWAAHEDAPVRVIADGDAVAVEVRFTGATHDGREIGFDAVDIFHFRGDRISSLATWYDLTDVRARLALAGQA
jgi:ketosteroid isomerase-like protein